MSLPRRSPQKAARAWVSSGTAGPGAPLACGNLPGEVTSRCGHLQDRVFVLPCLQVWEKDSEKVTNCSGREAGGWKMPPDTFSQVQITICVKYVLRSFGALVYSSKI